MSRTDEAAGARLSHEELLQSAPGLPRARHAGQNCRCSALKVAFHESIKRAAELGLLGPSPTLPEQAASMEDAPGTAPAGTSDGGSTGYYELPAETTELNDLIEHKGMSFRQHFQGLLSVREKDAANRMRQRWLRGKSTGSDENLISPGDSKTNARNRRYHDRDDRAGTTARLSRQKWRLLRSEVSRHWCGDASGKVR